MRAARQPFILVMIALGMLTPLSMLALGLAAQAQDSFDRRAMLQSIVDNVILPGQLAFNDASNQLASAAQDFLSEPTATALSILQQAWRSASDAWEQIAIFDLDLRLTSYHNQIDKTPPNYEFIDALLQGADEITEPYVNGIGSTSKGLPAIEYLIFSIDSTPAEIIDSFADPRRRAFLLALAQNIARKASEITDYWSPDGRQYAARFIKADQSGGELQGSMNMLVNKIFVMLATDLQMWIGEPSGIATDGEARPQLVEARRSGHSLSHIAQHLIAMQRIFNGGPAEEDLGFDDYLDFLGAMFDDRPLSAVINERFASAIASIEALELPLAAAVVEAPQDIAAIYENIRQLQIPLRADMKSHLSILITLSDRDGDQ